MKILGIETSCDETAAAVVEYSDGGALKLLSNVVASSIDLHALYGGVVPEIAARSHVESIQPVIDQALDQAFSGVGGVNRSQPWEQIDGIAVTQGPGLGGSLLVGVMAARTLAIAHSKPLYAINHVEAHAYANFITEIGSNTQKAKSKKGAGKTPYANYHLPTTSPEFPVLGLIVSGGHSQLVLWRDHFDYTLLGQTNDDAIGEAFDKVAKILGLPYPGGPSISKRAQEGDPYKYQLPKANISSVSPALAELRSVAKEIDKKGHDEPSDSYTTHSSPPPNYSNYDFSFSGLKTAVLRLAQAEIGADYSFPSHKVSEKLSEAQKTDIAASFQRVAIETIVDKTTAAAQEFQPKSIVLGGGVAASQELRNQLAKKLSKNIYYPDIKLCTDNAAMVAALGCFKATLKQPSADPYSLEIEPDLGM